MAISITEFARLWLLSLGLAALAYFLVDRNRQYQRLKQFKGPTIAGWSWWWHTRAVMSGAAYKYYSNATKNYGALARVAPNLLLTSSPEVWAQINAVRSPWKRAEYYYHAARFTPGQDNLFTDCDNHSHDARRKKLVGGYAGKENPNLEASIDIHIKEFIHLIRSKYASSASSTEVSKPMDLASKIQYLALDVITEVSLGKSFGDLRADKDVNNYLAATAEGLQIANHAYGLGTIWLRDLPIIGAVMSPSEKDATGFGRMKAEIRKVVENRKLKSTAERSDMISSFIRHGVSGEDLFHEIVEQILAGSDTTAAAIRVILLYLISHPRVYMKLRAEVDEAVRLGHAPGPDSIILDAEARQLPYLMAVIREAMRVHPPVLNLFAREAPEEGDVVKVEGKDVFIPGRTIVGYAGWAMLRDNRSVFGEDTKIFRPERWFVDKTKPGEAERLARMHKTTELLFGHGRWLCIGRVTALIEIYKIVFELMRHFDMAISNPHKPWKAAEYFGLWDIKDMWVDVTIREPPHAS